MGNRNQLVQSGAISSRAVPLVGCHSLPLFIRLSLPARRARAGKVQKGLGDLWTKLRALEGSVINAATSRAETTLMPAMTRKAAWNP